MFICQVTKKCSEAGEKSCKITVLSRDKVYKEWRINEELRRMEEVVVGYGKEIVRELTASEEGVQVWNEMSEPERSKFLASF